jgi:putative acetyltransferase
MAAKLMIAEEDHDDELAIDEVLAAAFGRDDEAELVMSLRGRRGLEFAAVMKLDDEVIGHVAYSAVNVGGIASDPPVLALAPVAVDPAHQRQGYGSKLIHWAQDEVARRGFPAVIVVGEPAFYGRFGFEPASRFEIVCPFEVPGEYFMALELRPRALTELRGIVGYRPEFAALS